MVSDTFDGVYAKRGIPAGTPRFACFLNFHGTYLHCLYVGRRIGEAANPGPPESVDMARSRALAALQVLGLARNGPDLSRQFPTSEGVHHRKLENK